jgi:hypothetical protein
MQPVADVAFHKDALHEFHVGLVRGVQIFFERD